MTGRVVFLLEERSMKELLDGLLPRLFPDLVFLCIPHDGKGDLEKSIPRKLRGWREPGVRFVVVRDNDREDCIASKEHLGNLCSVRPRGDYLIRIACQELEAWYLGEPEAWRRRSGKSPLAESAPRPATAARMTFRILKGRSPSWFPNTRSSRARVPANHLTRERNRSPSFQAAMAGIERLACPAPSTHH